MLPDHMFKLLCIENLRRARAAHTSVCTGVCLHIRSPPDISLSLGTPGSHLELGRCSMALYSEMFIHFTNQLFHFKSLDPCCTSSSPPTAPCRAVQPVLFSQVTTQRVKVKEFPLKRSRCVKKRNTKKHRNRLDRKNKNGFEGRHTDRHRSGCNWDKLDLKPAMH